MMQKTMFVLPTYHLRILDPPKEWQNFLKQTGAPLGLTHCQLDMSH